MNGRSRIVSVFLFLIILIQFWVAIFHVLIPLKNQIVTVQHTSAWERSALLSFGDEFTAYLRFLKTIIPQDGRVVIPPKSVDAAYGNVGIMQFFLFPREIVNCPSDTVVLECLDTFSGMQTFFLSVYGFPDRKLVGDSRQYEEFENSLGLFYPAE